MDFSDWWLRHLLWNCPNMNIIWLHDDQSTLVKVMAWCRQATSHYSTWANVDQDLCCHMVSLGHNELRLDWDSEVFNLGRLISLQVTGPHNTCISQPQVHPCFARAVKIIAYLAIIILTFILRFQSKVAFCTPNPTFGIRAQEAVLSCFGGKNAGGYGCYCECSAGSTV